MSRNTVLSLVRARVHDAGASPELEEELVRTAATDLGEGRTPRFVAECVAMRTEEEIRVHRGRLRSVDLHELATAA